MLAPLDQAALGEFVENAHEGDRFDLEQFRQTALVDALASREIGDHLPLRTRQPEVAGALFEPLAHQAGDFMQHESEGKILGVHGEYPSAFKPA
jgi:hypothetical protein